MIEIPVSIRAMGSTGRRPALLQFRNQDTRRNLPVCSSRKRGESNFLCAFEKAYFGVEAIGGFAGREFGVEGFGRPDLVWMVWTRPKRSTEFSAVELRRIRLTAFEAKVCDWRKGLQQAYRYRYFANRSLLLVTPSVAANAKEFLATFRRLRVGLWAFDVTTGRIRKLFTPRSASPLSNTAREKALAFLSRTAKSPLVSRRKPGRRGSRRCVVDSIDRAERRPRRLR